MTDLEGIPPILAPFIRLPKEHSQTLITSVLGASSNWLLLQFLAGILGNAAGRTRTRQQRESLQGAAPPAEGNVAVILVSWMQDWSFWRTEARRSLGIELNQLSQGGRLSFIDGLTHLFSQPETNHRSTSTQSSPKTPPENPIVLHNHTLDHLHKVVLDTSENLKARGASHVVLMLDSPSILLQTTRPPVDSLQLTQLFLRLRSEVHSLVVSLYADDPFMAPAAALDIQEPGVDRSIWTPLETDNASFVTGMAHQSRMVFQCRRLDTGWADDVSGVIRITQGAAIDEEESESMDDGEWLYLVAADGTVKMWSRGTA